MTLVGLLLAKRGKLRLDGGLKQTLITVVDGLGHQFAAGRVAIDIMALQTIYGLLVVGGDGDAEDTLFLTSAHGQQTVGRAALQRFRPVEVVAVFGGFVRIGLGLDDLGCNHGLTAEGIAELLTTALVFADGLGNDVLGTFDGVCDAKLRVES